MEYLIQCKRNKVLHILYQSAERGRRRLMRAQTLGWIKLLPWASCASRQDNPSLQDTNFANFIHFLLEFIPLALLSRYLAWHPAAERGCVCGARVRLPA